MIGIGVGKNKKMTRDQDEDCRTQSLLAEEPEEAHAGRNSARGVTGPA
jgi:hypothetical protein